MHVGDDRFVIAVARYGDGPRARIVVGGRPISVRWVRGFSLDPLRRASGISSTPDVDGDLALRRMREACRVAPAELTSCVLRPYPSAFAVYEPGTSGTPPVGVVVGHRRWAFDDDAQQLVGPSAVVVDVPLAMRVAWCVEMAVTDGRALPVLADVRRSFMDRMMALHKANETTTTPLVVLPDPAAWYRPASGAMVAVQSREHEVAVMFGTMLDNDTMHVQVTESTLPGHSLKPAVDKFYGGTRFPRHALPSQWVPSVLGARLAVVRVVHTLKELTPEDGATIALPIMDAVPLFRDKAAAVDAQRWLIAAHAAMAHGEMHPERSPHRVRLALECVSGATSALYALPLPLGAAYSGPTQVDSAHTLSIARAPPIVIRPSPSGWRACPRCV